MLFFSLTQSMENDGLCHLDWAILGTLDCNSIFSIVSMPFSSNILHKFVINIQSLLQQGRGCRRRSCHSVWNLSTVLVRTPLIEMGSALLEPLYSPYHCRILAEGVLQNVRVSFRARRFIVIQIKRPRSEYNILLWIDVYYRSSLKHIYKVTKSVK